jgi:uncharacterized protein (TIGR00645 family)
MSNRIEKTLESTIFSSRWLLAPFFVGLVLSVLLLLFKFLQEILHLVLEVVALDHGMVVIKILTLVDMCLVGSLLLMIIFSGYEIFVSKIHVDNHEDKPSWMGKVDFSGLKLKVIGAIVAISAIDLLKTFVEMKVMDESGQMVIMWKVIIHLTFVFSGVMFALMDRIAAGTEPH